LVEAGLDQREREGFIRDKLLENNAAMYKSVDELADRLAEFEKYARTQFQSIKADHTVHRLILGSTNNLAAALGANKFIPPESVREGKYDGMPERFKAFEELAGRNFIKDE